MKYLISGLLTLSIFTTGMSLPLIAQITEEQTQTTQENLGQLFQLGVQQLEQGQFQQALDTFQEALTLARQQGDRSEEGTTLNNIGYVYSQIGQPRKALEYYNQALPLRRETGDRSGEATTLSTIGEVYSSLGQPQKALEFSNQALPIRRETGDRSGEAATLNNIGEVYGDIGQPQKALEFYNQALPIKREVGDRSGEATTLSNIAFLYRNTGKPTEAIIQWEKSLEISLEIRKGLAQEARQVYINSIYDTAIALTDLLIEQNQPQKAFEWLNLVTTFELADYNRLIDAKVSNPEAQKAIDQWNVKQIQLQTLRQKIDKEYSSQLVEQIQTLDKEIKIEAEGIIKRFPEVAERIETTPEDITRLQESLPDGTVVIQPVLLTGVKKVPNSLALFILSKNQAIRVKKVPIPDPKALEQLMVDYRSILSDSYAIGWRTQGEQLYDLLIRPIEAEIQALTPKKIAIIASGKLRYIPFETLWDKTSEKYLIEKYPIHYYTRLSTNSLATATRQKPKSIQVLALGNPIIQEPYNLKDAEQEVKAIPAIFSSSQIYLNSQATRKNLQQLAVRFPYLHLATHACFQREGCCLSENCTDGKKDMEPNTVLFADEQFNLANVVDLNLGETELIILSACKTALREDSDGNEISGIAYLLEQAGARAVMASLWSVDDETTQEIMVQFYKNLQQGMDKTEALRQAKLTQKDRHPFFWSPFILIGNGD